MTLLAFGLVDWFVWDGGPVEEIAAAETDAAARLASSSMHGRNLGRSSRVFIVNNPASSRLSHRPGGMQQEVVGNLFTELFTIIGNAQCLRGDFFQFGSELPEPSHASSGGEHREEEAVSHTVQSLMSSRI
jgi:hypothetical protein